MAYLDIDTSLGRKLRKLRDAARVFGETVVRPAGVALDKLIDPADVIADKSVLWDVFRAYREEGYHKLMIPAAFGGKMGRVNSLAIPLTNEEMGYADGGLAISLLVSSMPFVFAAFSPHAEIRDWARAYAADRNASMIGCWAITEPAHGTDWILGVSKAGNDPRTAPSLIAVKKGDEYILNGAKSAWVSNGTIATHAVLHVGIEQSMGVHGSGVALCPLDLQGITRGAPLNKVGQRALNQGEIIFNEVKLPEKYMLVSIPGMFGANLFGHTFLGIANSSMGSTFAGQAKATLDETLKFVRENRRDGRLLCEDPDIRIKGFRMFQQVESARLFSQKVANHFLAKVNNPMLSFGALFRSSFFLLGKSVQAYTQLHEKFDTIKSVTQGFTHPETSSDLMSWGKYGVASKINATETAYRVAREAFDIFGEKAHASDYPIEKMLRDARAATIEDGVNDALALASFEGL